MWPNAQLLRFLLDNRLGGHKANRLSNRCDMHHQRRQAVQGLPSQPDQQHTDAQIHLKGKKKNKKKGCKKKTEHSTGRYCYKEQER